MALGPPCPGTRDLQRIGITFGIRERDIREIVEPEPPLFQRYAECYWLVFIGGSAVTYRPYADLISFCHKNVPRIFVQLHHCSLSWCVGAQCRRSGSLRARATGSARRGLRSRRAVPGTPTGLPPLLSPPACTGFPCRCDGMPVPVKLFALSFPRNRPVCN